jgi:cytochrome b6
MNKTFKKYFRLALAIGGVIAIALGVFFTTHGQAVAESETISAANTASTSALPPSETEVNPDTCLHCHITGEDKGIWTPFARWVVFGSVGMVFAFGMVRSFSTYIIRKPWKPLYIRAAEWVDERYNISDPLEKVLKKPVPKYATRWFYCLGGITAFLFLVQGVTGIMLAFYYKPTPDAAYASIQYIESQVYFGSAIRMIHHWAANGMIVMCIAHMLRVFIMGAYKPPRELNWISGVILLVVTLGFGLTGYLLPLDQRAWWATTVATEIAGALPIIGNLLLIFARVGWNISAETLSRFYAIHIIILPLVTLGMMFAHFLMIRQLGIKKPL